MVHAVRPTAAQPAEPPIFWIRDEFIARPHGLGKTVVFGHTPMREVLTDLPNKIGIDTGAHGMLTALELPG
jgi:serine/threonine protein phosphatase 1